MNTRKRILVADDEEKNRKLIGVILESNGYTYDTVADGRAAVERAAAEPCDLILLDVMMPVMNGYEACRALKENAATRTVPVIMVTSLSDRDSRIHGLQAGASDFLTKPLDSTELLLRCANLLKVKEYDDYLANYNEDLRREVARTTEELRASYRDTILRLTNVSEYKDEETASHITRVGLYCAEIARALGWPLDDVETIELASPMHDIGKVGIPSEILLKRGRLTEVEFSLMKTHTDIGAKILTGSSSKIIQMSERIAHCHHERWDGGGYPRGIRGEEIPLEARIMNIADQYDALRSVRPYKPAFDHGKTCDIIMKGDGRTMPGHFDPLVLEVFTQRHAEFRRIYDESQG